MFYIGVFGGADAESFACLSVALPTNPLPLKSLFLPLNPIFPVMVLYTTYFLSASATFYIVSRGITWIYIKHIQLFENIRELSILRRLLVVLTGYKIELETLQREVYLYSMEGASVKTASFMGD